MGSRLERHGIPGHRAHPERTPGSYGFPKATWNSSGPYITDGDLYLALESPQSVIDKVNYVKRQRFAGTFMWNITADDENSSLTKAIDKAMRGR